MQVFKKISLCLVCLSLIGCSTTNNELSATRGGADAYNTDVNEINISSNNSFRVGVLLPLTGTAAKQGMGLKNATMLALEDVKNPNLVLQYYDTKSTESGARIAAENAIAQRSNLIIGPLMSTEVQAISSETIYRGVPVIAFSTSQEVLQPTVYTLGLLVEEQVDRIMSYAASKGRRRFALLLPDNNNGSAVAKAAIKSAQKNGVEVTVIGFYSGNSTDFSEIIKNMTDYKKRNGSITRLKESLQAKANQGDESAKKALQRLATKESLGDIGFDALIIPESGAKLTSAISMFAYYDVAYPQVQFLGTSIWENSKLNNESMIANSLYPALSRTHSAYFASKYANTFAERPSSLYSFGYDSIALANELSKQNTNNLNLAITNPDGYAGINGAFRLFEDGTNQHSLDIMQVQSNSDVVVDEAPRKFLNNTDSQPLKNIEITSDYRAPLIYGKDAATAQILIFGQVLPVENQPYDYNNIEKEREVINEELKALNIVIP